MARKKSIQPENENGQDQQPEVFTETKSAGEGTIESAIFDDGKTFAEHSEQVEQIEQPAQTEKTERAEEFDLNKIMAEYGAPVPEEKRRRKPRKPKEAQAEPARVQLIIPGRLFVTVCDNALTSGIGALDAWISKNPINTDLLKLNEQQVADLSPLAEEAVKAMKLENDPITVYFGSLAAIYLSNYLALKSFMLKQEKENRK